MELHQDLDAFLPRLHEELQRAGMSEKDSAFVCLNVRSGVTPRPIKTLEGYQDAWLICNAMENILTTLDDGSEAAAFCISIGQAVIDFEDAFHAKHGYCRSMLARLKLRTARQGRRKARLSPPRYPSFRAAPATRSSLPLSLSV